MMVLRQNDGAGQAYKIERAIRRGGNVYVDLRPVSAPGTIRLMVIDVDEMVTLADALTAGVYAAETIRRTAA